MERRQFLKSLFAVAGAVGVAALLPKDASAMPLADPAKGLPENPAVAPEPAVATPEDIEGARIDNVRWGYRRRRRFIFRRRRFIWRRRRVIYRRRRFIRRVYRRRYYY